MRSAMTGAFALLLATIAVAAPAPYGTAEEAHALLEKAVVALKADKAKALELFNSGEEGFRDRDLYVFCANASDGVTTAHPMDKGVALQDRKDAKGFAFGQQMKDTATEGSISEITYVWPRPDSETPLEKVSYYTKIGDQICGVGYYK